MKSANYFLILFLIFNYSSSIASGQGNSSTVPTIKGPGIGGPFTLTNTENQTVTEKDLLGKWVLLYFGYTFSPDVGPEQLQIMAKTIHKLSKPFSCVLYHHVGMF